MTCTAPTGITCTITPAIVTFANGKPVSQPDLSFQSQGALRNGSVGFSVPTFFLTILSCLLMLRRRRTFRRYALGLVVGAFFLGLGGCSSTTNNQVTPNGTYTVTGTAQTISAITSVVYTVTQ
jgi:hypothetical protein